MTELQRQTAMAGYRLIEAEYDIEAYLPPDDSESWLGADELLAARDDAEKQFLELLENIGDE